MEQCYEAKETGVWNTVTELIREECVVLILK